ncbi:MAG: cysteine-rich CWC family protein [Rhodocyclaceae bacterium]
MSIGCKRRTRCPGCGRGFECGMAGGLERCWCAELPPLTSPPDTGRGCYCPDCLKTLLAAENPVRPDREA